MKNNTKKTVRFPIKKTNTIIPEYDYNVRQYATKEITPYAIGEDNFTVIVDYDEFYNAPVSLPDFEKFCPYADKYYTLFGVDLVGKALHGLTMKDLTRKENHEESTALMMAKNFNCAMLINGRKNVEIEHYKGSWTRKEVVLGYSLVTHTPYSSLYLGKLSRTCLLAKYPYLKAFEFDAYSFDSNMEPEFYLKTSEGSLYVPVKALELNDVNIIVNRMKVYFSGYYKGNEEKVANALKPLDTEEAKRLFDILNNGGRYINIDTITEEPEYEIQEPLKRYRYILMKACETEVFEPWMYETYTEAIEALENLIEKDVKEEAPCVWIDRDVANGGATAGVTCKSGMVRSFRITRIEI